MISSGVYRFLGMTMTSLVAVQSIIHPGPNLPGQVTGIGHDLFFTESEIMTTILLKLNELGIVGLPVHDALYVPMNRIEETKRIMEEGFREIVGLEGVIRVTRPSVY
jgi:hypothetical protein